MVTVSELLFHRPTPPATTVCPEVVSAAAIAGGVGIYNVTRVNGLLATGCLPPHSFRKAFERSVYVTSSAVLGRTFSQAAARHGLTKYMHGYPASIATATATDYSAAWIASLVARGTGLTTCVQAPRLAPTLVVAATRTVAVRHYRPYIARSMGKLPSDVAVTAATGFTAGATAGLAKSVIVDKGRNAVVNSFGTGLAVMTSLTMQQLIYQAFKTDIQKKK